jgi:DNA-binding NarL/FixJ family response regulator
VLKRVLIADDSAIVRNVMKIFVEDRPNVSICGEAVNGLEAVDKARTLKPDLVLLDFAMPGMNGAEVAALLKKEMPWMPVILFTMYGDDIGGYLLSSIGVDAVLSKPEGLTTLAKVVDAVLLPTSGTGTAPQ